MGVMDKFEDQVGRLDQTDAMMQGSLQGALGTMTPETEVDALIMEVGDAEGLAVDEMLSKDRVADNTLKVEDDVRSRRCASRLPPRRRGVRVSLLCCTLCGGAAYSRPAPPLPAQVALPQVDEGALSQRLAALRG